MSPRRPDMPPLRRGDLAADPIDQLASWWQAARSEVALPEAMALATVDADGAPDVRMVLLRGFDADGLRFFTNYESRKASQLDAAPRAAAVLYWRELDRQVRARGPVERLAESESDAYFAQRDRESRIGAWASPQSRRMDSRDALERRAAEIADRFAGGEVPRPPFWGGFLLRPSELEFWQGRAGRLHDRFRYSRKRGEWRIERLGP